MNETKVVETNESAAASELASVKIAVDLYRINQSAPSETAFINAERARFEVRTFERDQAIEIRGKWMSAQALKTSWLVPAGGRVEIGYA